MSVLEATGLPSQFGTTLLLLFLILSIVPFFSGKDFGVLKIPEFGEASKRRLRLVGPLLLLTAIILHLPLLPLRTPTESHLEDRNPATSVDADIEDSAPGKINSDLNESRASADKEAAPGAESHEEASGNLEDASAAPTTAIPTRASSLPSQRKHSYICEGIVIFPNESTDQLVSCSNIQIAFTPFLEDVNRDYIRVDFDRIEKLAVRRLSDDERLRIEEVFKYGGNVIRSFEITYWDGTTDTGFGPAGHFLETSRMGSNNLLAVKAVLFKKNGVFKRDYSR